MNSLKDCNNTVAGVPGTTSHVSSGWDSCSNRVDIDLLKLANPPIRG